jgi:hypothetical protein
MNLVHAVVNDANGRPQQGSHPEGLQNYSEVFARPEILMGQWRRKPGPGIIREGPLGKRHYNAVNTWAKGKYPTVASWTTTGHSTLDCNLAPDKAAIALISQVLWKAWQNGFNSSERHDKT